jgi:hypothetical protein
MAPSKTNNEQFAKGSNSCYGMVRRVPAPPATDAGTRQTEHRYWQEFRFTASASIDAARLCCGRGGRRADGIRTYPHRLGLFKGRCAPADYTAGLRYHHYSRRGLKPSCRAPCDTLAPGFRLARTMRALSSLDHRRRLEHVDPALLAHNGLRRWRQWCSAAPSADLLDRIALLHSIPGARRARGADRAIADALPHVLLARLRSRSRI